MDKYNGRTDRNTGTQTGTHRESYRFGDRVLIGPANKLESATVICVPDSTNAVVMLADGTLRSPRIIGMRLDLLAIPADAIEIGGTTITASTPHQDVKNHIKALRLSGEFNRIGR